MTTLPTADDLGRQAREAASRCGVDLDAYAGDRPVTSPVNGAPLASLRWQGAAIAKYLLDEVGATKVFVIDNAEAYGEPLADRVADA